MTNDKALEAALLPCPFCGSDDVMVLDVEPTGQMSEYSHVHCCDCQSNGPMKSSDDAADKAWNRRAPFSALPGEAEVVMEQIAHKEQIGIWANELTSALSLSDFLREDWSFDDSVDLEKEVVAQLLDIIRSAITHPGLNLVASLEAMQARAEAAERERDEAIAKGERQWAGWVKEEVARKAAEARVKELDGEVANLRAATNQSRLAFSGMVSVQSAIDLLDKLGGSNG